MPTVCPICNASAGMVEANYPGYRFPEKYSILDCAQCRVSFAEPMRSDPSIYEAIYRQAALVPGYDRYDGFARQVLRARSPLDFLAAREEPYWAVRDTVRGLPAGAAILDVASGLGYLTYALAAERFDAWGLDISEAAVARAKATFGERYVCADLFEFAARHQNVYDAVIMLENIEHVENPQQWLMAGLGMLKPGGLLLVTTPNRDYYADGTVWETDAPPVHLWWFTLHALQRLAQGADVDIEAVNFTACELSIAVQYSDAPIRTRRSPMLDAEGRPFSRFRSLLWRAGLLGIAKQMYAIVHSRKGSAEPHPAGLRETLAVRIRKRAD